MTLISGSSTVGNLAESQPWERALAPARLPTIVTENGPVAALRRRPVVALGSLVERLMLDTPRLVSAVDLSGRAWWIPAVAVWADADNGGQPQHPRAIGLASGRSREAAVLAGLSDRLGWEANAARERGRVLPELDDVGVDHGDGTTVYDGRLGHGIPTVVVVRDAVALWGAGSTFAAAYHRALFGHQGSTGPTGELDMLRAWLTAVGLDVVVVDMGSPVIEQAGVQRLQVQLLASSYERGRPWDGDPMN
jgi:hypothetical protein